MPWLIKPGRLLGEENQEIPPAIIVTELDTQSGIAGHQGVEQRVKDHVRRRRGSQSR